MMSTKSTENPCLAQDISLTSWKNSTQEEPWLWKFQVHLRMKGAGALVGQDSVPPVPQVVPWQTWGMKLNSQPWSLGMALVTGRKHEPAGEVLRHLRNAMNGVRGRFYKACAGDHQALSPSRTSWSIIYVLGTPHWIGTKLLQNVAHLPDECKYLISAFFKNVFTGVHAKQTYNHKGEEIFLFLIINN